MRKTEHGRKRENLQERDREGDITRVKEKEILLAHTLPNWGLEKQILRVKKCARKYYNNFIITKK